jgi:energy-coupling factor transporter ATP-binding protein EcfA2
MFLFGPPGSGKSMIAHRLLTILPPLSDEQALEVTQVHSLAVMSDKQAGPIRHAPFRTPHHSASCEGIIGGGRIPRSGEASLAPAGIRKERVSVRFIQVSLSHRYYYSLSFHFPGFLCKCITAITNISLFLFS